MTDEKEGTERSKVERREEEIKAERREEEREADRREASIPKYRVLQGSFIEPWYVKEGAVIEFDGEPGPHLEAMNAAAQDMMKAYYTAHPEATLTPLDRLPITPGVAVKPSLTVLGFAPQEEIQSFVDMSDKTGRGGKAKVTSLAEAKASGTPA
jgi:hypothetical protein